MIILKQIIATPNRRIATALENCNNESNNLNIKSENEVLSMNCKDKLEDNIIQSVDHNDKSEICSIGSVNCKIDVHNTGIMKYGSNQDLDLILNDNNYKSLQEKKIIREIGKDD